MKKLFVILGFLCGLSLHAQIVIDEVVGVVGAEPILLSEVEEQAQNDFMEGQAGARDFKTKCGLFERLLFEKMLLNQAEKDSLIVSDDQVETEMDRRMQYFIIQAGGEKQLEDFLGQTIPEIKKNFRDNIRKQLLVQQMQQKVIERVKVTPAEVKAYFNEIPKDSLPLVASEIEYAQITILPKPSDEARAAARRHAQKIREDIGKGSSFCLKARLESEDIASAQNCGELGFLRREDLVPEFSAAAFRLKNSTEISEVVETEFGFHIIQLIEKRGEMANFRHILIRAKVSDEALDQAAKQLDSIAIVLEKDSLAFSKLAEKYSSDMETRFNGGKVVNQRAGSSKFKDDELDPYARIEIMPLQPGQVSRPHVYQMQTGQTAFRIVKLLSRSAPHVADLKNDFPVIEQAALANKQADAVAKWIEKKQGEVYIRIGDIYAGCPFDNNWKQEK